MFRKPDDAFRINCYVPGTGTRCGNRPTCDSRGNWIVHSNSIRYWHREPYFTTMVQCYENWLTITSGKSNSGCPVMGSGVKQGDFAWWCAAGATRCKVTARQSNPDATITIKCR